MPLYMLLLMGLIYFGYATLSRQRQNFAGAAASWLPGTQRADEHLAEFWHSAVPPSGTVSGQTSEAWSGDMHLVAAERVREGDEYYGNEVPSQLDEPHSLGRGGWTFDIERIAVSLWTYALGEVEQYVEWVPGQGAISRTRRRYDHMASYLNAESPYGLRWGGGFVQAGESSSPQISSYAQWITMALDGLDAPWLERRSSTIETTYRPPFFSQVYSEPGTGGATFSQHVTGAYAEQSYLPTTFATFDLTGRGPGIRATASEAGLTAEDLLAQGARFIGNGDPLPPADELDKRAIEGVGTLEELWTSQ